MLALKPFGFISEATSINTASTDVDIIHLEYVYTKLLYSISGELNCMSLDSYLAFSMSMFNS